MFSHTVDKTGSMGLTLIYIKQSCSTACNNGPERLVATRFGPFEIGETGSLQGQPTLFSKLRPMKGLRQGDWISFSKVEQGGSHRNN